MKRTVCYLSLAFGLMLFACLPQQTKEAVESPLKKYKVIAYVAGWKGFDFKKIEAEKITHINYAFANIIDGEVRFGSKEDSIDKASLNIADLVELRRLKDKNPDLKILVSVGGWVWSTHFSAVALTDKSRQKFAQSAVRFLKEHQLDGIDLDWEYPNQIGAGNPHRPEDKENFTLLLKTVREALDKQGEEDTAHYLLTIATGADSVYIANTELGKAHQYLDFINIMTYDFHHGASYQTGHQSNLFPSNAEEATDRSAVKAVYLHVSAAVPVEKLVMGVPFYGRVWKGVDKKNNGLYQQAQTTGAIEFYRVVAKEYTQEKGYKRYWDSSACAPYLWNEDSAIFVSYDDTLALDKKINHLKEKGMGGVMFWEYSNDNEGELLEKIFEGLEG